MIKILIVEDQTMLKDALEYMINGQNDMEVIGGTDDASKALELCKKLKPDLLLMDVVTKNNSSGIRNSAEIRKELPEIKIIIMTSYPDFTFIEEAKKAGAHSFLQKNMDKDHLLYVIRSTMKGMGFYPGPGDSPFAIKFTDREIAIIRLICQGVDRDEIAAQLGISESLVKKEITSILDKSGFDSIAKFAIFAVSQGLVAPEIY